MKRLAFLLLLLPILVRAQNVSGDSIVAYAKSFIGTKYCYAQCTPKKGFDCSGFVYYVFRHFGVEVPRASLDYEHTGRKVKIDSTQAGDIIVFTGTNFKNRKPGHVGIIVSNDNDGVVFIHSSSGKKNNGVVMTNFTQSEFYQKRFIKVVRLIAIVK